MKKKPTPLPDYACPKCGNTTSQKGISYAWLEWRVAEVLGTHDGKVVVDFNDNEGESIGDNLSHFHCNACSWKWFDHERENLDSYDIRPR